MGQSTRSSSSGARQHCWRLQYVGTCKKSLLPKTVNINLIQIYINKAIKSGCGDIMKTSVDMIFSFLMLDEVNSIIRMHESLIEFWLNEDESTCNDGRFDPLAMKAVIRLMTQLMLMAEWTLDRLRREEEKSGKKTQLVEPIVAPEHDDPDMRAKWIFLLETLLERTVNRFLRHLRTGKRFIQK